MGLTAKSLCQLGAPPSPHSTGELETREGDLSRPQGPASWGREAGVLALSTGTPGGWEGRSRGTQQGGKPGGCCGGAGEGQAGLRMRRASGG